MEKKNIIKALRNEDFLLSLSQDQRSSMPESPAGVVELDEEGLKLASGGIQLETDHVTHLNICLCGCG